jgi:hypothetical protein
MGFANWNGFGCNYNGEDLPIFLELSCACEVYSADLHTHTGACLYLYQTPRFGSKRTISTRLEWPRRDIGR